MKEIADYKLLKKCLIQIEENLGWGSSAAWPNEVFDKLSKVIQDSTGVMLSPTTLKRVWGKVNYSSSPSISTLNTLAKFAGFESWLDFKNQNSERALVRINKKLISNRGIIIGAAALLTLLFISLFSMVNIGAENEPVEIPASLKFSSHPITKGIPNSVVFDLDLDGINSDSIYIQQFWDVTKTIKLKQGQKQATGIYYFPGYFRAKLLVDGKIIKEHDLFIKSQGWLGTIDYEPVPKYIPSGNLVKGKLHFSESILREIAELEKPHNSSFHLVDDFSSISADNFILETEIKNVYREKWAVCQTVKLVVLGTKGAMVIPFSIPGCVSDLGIMLNDVYISGKENDLSVFGADFSEFRKIKLLVKDQTISIFLDDLEIYTSSYSEPVGNLAGIRFRFLGAGEVQMLNLFQAGGTPIYTGDFNPS